MVERPSSFDWFRTDWKSGLSAIRCNFSIQLFRHQSALACFQEPSIAMMPRNWNDFSMLLPLRSNISTGLSPLLPPFRWRIPHWEGCSNSPATALKLYQERPVSSVLFRSIRWASAALLLILNCSWGCWSMITLIRLANDVTFPQRQCCVSRRHSGQARSFETLVWTLESLRESSGSCILFLFNQLSGTYFLLDPLKVPWIISYLILDCVLKLFFLRE